MAVKPLISAAFALFAGLFVLAQTGEARASASEWVETAQTRLRLVSATSGVGSESTLRLGLEFRLKPGWKVYWRSPGDAGYPPSLDWSGSENFAGAVMHWPTPVRFNVLGFNTLGYKDEVVFPLDATLVEPGRPLRLRAKVDYLTCSDICVPYQASLALDLPDGGAQTTAFTHLIGKYAARVPNAGTGRGLMIEKVETLGEGEQRVLRVVARSDTPFVAPDVYVEGPDLIEFGVPKAETAAGGRIATLELTARAIGKAAPALVGSALTLTLVDGPRALESTAAVVVARSTLSRSYFSILLLALLGGLILNLMPCVLPVLSIKLLSVVSHGGGEARPVRRSFLASAAGILTAFLALAGILAILKSAGLSIGWGIQFQQPLFLVAMTVIVTLFAANMWGLFEIQLPASLGGALARAGGRRSLSGDFLTGAFATVLATPCSAPFLGTAVGFALSRGTADIFAIFAVLGVGLATPYLLVAALPALATRLPRPGPWMVWLKRVLGVALAATAVWLLTVVASIADDKAAYVVGALMIASVFILASGPALLTRARLATPAIVGVLALAALAAPEVLPRAESAAPADVSATHWRPFDWNAIPGLVASGKTVFVDVTADWCITCKANKALVLNRGVAAELLVGADVVAMIADWTRPSDEISAYLASFGRYGIPFDVVYGPGAPQGVPLPELLTRESVAAGFALAGGAASEKSLAGE